MSKKQLIFSFVIFLLFLISPKPALAHGGPPFIKINSEINNSNQIFSGSILFKITYESAKNDFVVGNSLNFQIEKSLLPVAPSSVTDNSFVWDFGDKSDNEAGLDVTHKYSKPGSYFVILKVKDPNYQEAIEFESIMVNIVPNKDYALPVAVIKVNGKVYNDPLKNPILLEKGDNVEFDATASKGNIKSYKWDFSDSSSLETKGKLNHNFNFNSPYSYSFFPILRVEDQNGLISDAIVQISNQSIQGTGKASSAAKTSTSTKPSSSNGIYFLVAGILIVFFSGLTFIYFKKKT